MEIYKNLGFTVEDEIFEDPRQKIRGVFLVLDQYRIELLEAINPTDGSPLDPFLSRGIKLYHHAFLVNQIHDAISDLLNQGAVVQVAPVESVAFKGKKIAFLMLKNMTLVELIES